MINRPFRRKSYLSPRGARLGRLWEEFAPRAGAGEGVVPACVGALPVGREGGPTRVRVCVCAGRGWAVWTCRKYWTGNGDARVLSALWQPQDLGLEPRRASVFPAAKWGC